MKLGSELGSIMELRDYTKLEGRIRDLLHTDSWPHILEELGRASQEREIVRGWGIPLRPGILRDSIVALLGIQDMPGLDVDFLKSFKELDERHIEDLRLAARHLAINLMRSQIAAGSTFFMDTELMKENDQAVLVPGVIESRTNEIEALEPNPPLSDVYSTYYGFTVLTSGGLVRDRGGITENTHEKLMTILGDIGNVKEIPSKQLKFSYLSFRTCSSHMKVLLWNLLRTCVGGDKGQRAGLEVLGELGDSRACELLHLRLDEAKSDGVKRHLVAALGRIGHPSSLPRLRSLMSSRSYYYSKLQQDSTIAVGGIRSPEVRNLLSSNSGYGRRSDVALVKAKGNTFDDRWESELRTSLSRTRPGSDLHTAVVEALRKVTALKETDLIRA
jgi:hypothetical protein